MADASNTAANAAIPARRAVSDSRSEASPGNSNAHNPARKEYAHRTKAIRRDRSPSSAILGTAAIFSETRGEGNPSGHAKGPARPKLAPKRRSAKVHHAPATARFALTSFSAVSQSSNSEPGVSPLLAKIS